MAGAIVPAGMVAANGFIDCTQWPGAISFMTVGLSFCGFQYNGFLVNHLDLAPPFAGMLMGIGNAIGTTARFWQQYFHGVIMSTSEVAYFKAFKTSDISQSRIQAGSCSKRSEYFYLSRYQVCCYRPTYTSEHSKFWKSVP